MTHRKCDDFAAFEPEFRERVDRMVWYSVAHHRHAESPELTAAAYDLAVAFGEESARVTRECVRHRASNVR